MRLHSKPLRDALGASASITAERSCVAVECCGDGKPPRQGKTAQAKAAEGNARFWAKPGDDPGGSCGPRQAKRWTARPGSNVPSAARHPTCKRSSRRTSSRRVSVYADAPKVFAARSRVVA